MGTVLYNRGLYAAMLAAEAAKKAQEIHGTADITPAMMRDGMEALEIDRSAVMESLGLPSFGPEFEVSCENHGGNGFGAIVQQWDAAAGNWVADHRLHPVRQRGHHAADRRGLGRLRRREQHRGALQLSATRSPRS
jgi:hypothetical protein